MNDAIRQWLAENGPTGNVAPWMMGLDGRTPPSLRLPEMSPEQEAGFIQPAGVPQRPPTRMGGPDGPSEEGPAAFNERIAQPFFEFMVPQTPTDLALAGLLGPARMLRPLSAAALAMMPGDAEASIFDLRRLGNLARSNPLSRSVREMGPPAPVEEAVVNPTTRHYLDNVRNSLEAPGMRPRIFQDPADPNTWLGALNPQTTRVNRRFDRMEDDVLSRSYHTTETEDLQRLWDDPQMFVMYPELRQMPVTFRNDGPPNTMGSYNHGTKQITIFPQTYGGQPSVRLPAQTREVLGEEIQHAMQGADGRLTAQYGFDALDALQPEGQQFFLGRAARELDGHYSNTPAAQEDLARLLAYRSQPNEWEASLAAERLGQRANSPRHFDAGNIGQSLFWRNLNLGWLAP